MKMKKIGFAIGAVMAMAAGSAYAGNSSAPKPPKDAVTVNGGTVHFKGSLIDAACAVSTDSQDLVVNLGQHLLHDFQTIGDHSELHPFTIKLEDCDTKVASTAAVSFSGTADTNSPTLLAVDSGGGNTVSAQGIGIKILDSASKPIPPNGSTFSTPSKLINGENVLRFESQYVSTTAKPTAGQANADATFIMQYQ